MKQKLEAAPGSLRKVWVNAGNQAPRLHRGWGGGPWESESLPGQPWERLSWRDPRVGSPGETVLVWVKVLQGHAPPGLAWIQAALFLRGPGTRKGGTALAPGMASAPVAKEHEAAPGCRSGSGARSPFWREGPFGVPGHSVPGLPG